MRDEQTEKRNRRLQERGESRRNIFLAPEKQTVIYCESQDARRRQQTPLVARARQLCASKICDEQQQNDGDDEAKANERHGRQIAQTEFDKRPCRTPYAAKQNPDDDGTRAIFCDDIY